MDIKHDQGLYSATVEGFDLLSDKLHDVFELERKRERKLREILKDKVRKKKLVLDLDSSVLAG